MAKKIIDNEIIQFVGLKDLEPMEQETVQRLTTEYYEKIKRDFNNITDLVVHIKTHGKGGERKKFSIHIRAIAPTVMIETDKSHDFDLARAVHKAFEDVRTQIHHKLHTDIN